MTKFKLFFLLINLILVVSFTAPSPLYAQAPPGQEYTLKSSDSQIEVYFDQKYGGAITKIFDHPNSGSQNLVDNSQAGAMFQIAFWQIPNHITVPPDCDPNMTDKWNDNPTQAGFQGDGHIGNPIGILGTNTSLPDPKEFIRYENSNQTIHFKSRFIRYDYCQTGIGAPTSNSACDAKAKTYYNNPQATCRDLWDTGFYLEQTAYFHPQLPHVLVTHNQLTQEDSHYNTTMITRSLPILFANNLPRLLYWKDGAKYLNTTGGAFLPDDDWGALVGLTNESGIGFVGSRHMTSNLPWEP